MRGCGATYMLDKVRTGFSRWASSTYSSKLIKRRKITGEQATVLNEREHTLTVPPLQFGLQRWGVRLHLFLAGSRGVLRVFFGF